jgi:hypothetical protein
LGPEYQNNPDSSHYNDFKPFLQVLMLNADIEFHEVKRLSNDFQSINQKQLEKVDIIIDRDPRFP